MKSIFNQKDLQAVAIALQIKLVSELVDEGHKATGALIKSVQVAVLYKMQEWQLVGSYLKQGRWLETGIKGSAWTKPPGRAEIAALIKWAKVKAISPKNGNYTSFAYAIAYAHRADKYPLPSSKRFSKNGRIVGWQSYVLDKELQGIANQLQRTTELKLDVQLDDLVNRITKNFS